MLRVESTTDGKYIGLTMPIDPLDPPAVIEVGDGTRFRPVHWVEVSAGVWRIWNSNYMVLAEAV